MSKCHVHSDSDMVPWGQGWKGIDPPDPPSASPCFSSEHSSLDSIASISGAHPWEPPACTFTSVWLGYAITLLLSPESVSTALFSTDHRIKECHFPCYRGFRFPLIFTRNPPEERGTFSLLLRLHLGGFLSSSALGEPALFPSSWISTPFGLSVFVWGTETRNLQ